MKDSEANFSQAVSRALETPGQCEFYIEPNLQEIESINTVILQILETWIHGPRPRIGGV